MESFYYLLPLVILIICLLIQARQSKIAAIHNLKRKRKGFNNMKELAKQFIGKDCIIYTVTDNTGGIQGVIKEINESGITVENKQGLQAVNLEYVVRIREYPRNKNGKKKSVVLD